MGKKVVIRLKRVWGHGEARSRVRNRFRTDPECVSERSERGAGPPSCRFRDGTVASCRLPCGVPRGTQSDNIRDSQDRPCKPARREFLASAEAGDKRYRGNTRGSKQSQFLPFPQT